MKSREIEVNKDVGDRKEERRKMADQELASIKKSNEQNVYQSREEFEHAILEIARCKRDIKYFAEKYFKIINLDAGLTTIKLYEKQKDLLDFFTKEKRCIVLASRQSSKCVNFWTKITLRHKRFNFKIKIPIGIFYLLMKMIKIIR